MLCASGYPGATRVAAGHVSAGAPAVVSNESYSAAQLVFFGRYIYGNLFLQRSELLYVVYSSAAEING